MILTARKDERICRRSLIGRTRRVSVQVQVLPSATPFDIRKVSMKLLFRSKEKLYKKDCINHDKERRTCRQNEYVFHCIRYCPNDCKRYEKVKKRKRFEVLKDTPPVSV